MGLNKNLGFTAEDRAENIRRIGEVAKLFTDSGTVTICSFISPYRKDRDAVRAGSKPGEFVEVYVHVPLEMAEQRDPKGLYKKSPRCTGKREGDGIHRRRRSLRSAGETGNSDRDPKAISRRIGKADSGVSRKRRIPQRVIWPCEIDPANPVVDLDFRIVRLLFSAILTEVLANKANFQFRPGGSRVGTEAMISANHAVAMVWFDTASRFFLLGIAIMIWWIIQSWWRRRRESKMVGFEVRAAKDAQ